MSGRLVADPGEEVAAFVPLLRGEPVFVDRRAPGQGGPDHLQLGAGQRAHGREVLDQVEQRVVDGERLAPDRDRPLDALRLDARVEVAELLVEAPRRLVLGAHAEADPCVTPPDGLVLGAS